MPLTANILMCPPEFYGIHYEINPWMNTERQADHGLAVRQWEALRDLLESLGAKITLLEPVDGLPDLVFTANAAMLYGDVAVLSRFLHPQRQGEEPINRAVLEQQGLRVIDTPGDGHFEGAGDALFCGETLVAGYRMRSDAATHQQIAAELGVRVLPVELVDTYYYHLDTCFCPLEPGVALWYPPAFDDYGQRVIREATEELIEVTDDEARHFACNAVVVGKAVVTNVGCPQLHAELRRRGYDAAETPLSEFVKAGGSAKCLTLRLDGEDAAGWRIKKATGG